MTLVLIMAGVMWAIGAAMGAPKKDRWIMIGGLVVAVIIAQLVLPQGHPLREATGGSVGLWLLLFGFVGVIWGYRRFVLGALRTAAQARQGPEELGSGAAPKPEGPFTNDELTRYARHIVLREIGGGGQRQLKEAKVLVVGAGGIGSPALIYLAAAGVGTLGVIDHDSVSLSNLQRQVAFGASDVGRPKVFAVAERLAEMNDTITVRPYHRAITREIAVELVADYDLVLEGSDDFATKTLVGQAAAEAGVPVIVGSLGQWDGQVSGHGPGTAPFTTAFPVAPDPALAMSCAEGGVLGPLPGMVGTLMAAEAVKLLSGAGRSILGRLVLIDALEGGQRWISLPSDE